MRAGMAIELEFELGQKRTKHCASVLAASPSVHRFVKSGK